MKMLVDNIAVLGIESCLLEGLKDAFTAQTVMRLEDDLVQKIAAENQDSVTERTRTQEKLRILEDGLHTLNRYRRSKHQGIEWPSGPSETGTTRQLTNTTDSDMNERDNLDGCERHDTNDLGSPTLVSEDVNNAIHDALQEVEPFVRTAGTQERTLDGPNGWSGFQSSHNIPTKPKKKSVIAAMFDNNAVGEQE